MENKIKHLKNNEGEYFGEINLSKDKKPIREGFGRMEFKDGSFYEGQWIQDKRTGKGRLYYKSGNVYQGTFKQNFREGFGEFFYKNSGDFYKGNWVGDKKDGKGAYFFHNGEWFEGSFKKDQKHGPGCKITNTISYQGNWKTNFKHGKFCFINSITNTQGFIWYNKGQIVKYETCNFNIKNHFSKNFEKDILFQNIQSLKNKNAQNQKSCKKLELINDFSDKKKIKKKEPFLERLNNSRIYKKKKNKSKVYKNKRAIKPTGTFEYKLRRTFRLKSIKKCFLQSNRE